MKESGQMRGRKIPLLTIATRNAPFRKCSLVEELLTRRARTKSFKL